MPEVLFVIVNAIMILVFGTIGFSASRQLIMAMTRGHIVEKQCDYWRNAQPKDFWGAVTSNIVRVGAAAWFLCLAAGFVCLPGCKC